MGTTPNRGFPYPEGTDYVASGDDAIQALAEAVDTALTTRMWASGVGGGENIAADTDWVLDYAFMDAGAGFTVVPDSGVAPRFTYTGPSGRWFMVTVGARLSSSSASEVSLSLLANGLTVQTAPVSAANAHLQISIPVQLYAASDLYATVKATGALGSYSHSWLRAVSL